MSEELEKLLDDGQTKDQTSSGEKSSEQIKEEEKLKAEEHLANIKKAIEQGNDELKKIRQAKKAGKTVEEIEEDDLPQIDFNDKGARAWDKRISDTVKPLAEEAAKEKEEIRTFAIKKFLEDKPELAKDPEKVKRVISTYEKIRTATERTTEGVLLDLRKAYAAEYADEILQNNENERLDRARGEVIFSDIAVSRGESSFREEKKAKPHLSSADAKILAKWDMSPEEWIKLAEKQNN